MSTQNFHFRPLISGWVEKTYRIGSWVELPVTVGLLVPQHPHSWQSSADGTSLIGHMILRKCIREPQGSGGSSSGSSTTSSILGLKVTGGKLMQGGHIGAVIERVKKGSIADLEGQLKPGTNNLAIECRSKRIRLKMQCLAVRIVVPGNAPRRTKRQGNAITTILVIP